MPKIVVYVGARAARELQAAGLDPAEWVREKVKEALTERRAASTAEPTSQLSGARSRSANAEE